MERADGRHKLRLLVSNEGVLPTYQVNCETILRAGMALSQKRRFFARFASTWARVYDSLSPNGSHADIHGGEERSHRGKAKSTSRLSSFSPRLFPSEWRMIARESLDNVTLIYKKVCFVIRMKLRDLFSIFHVASTHWMMKQKYKRNSKQIIKICKNIKCTIKI